MLVGLAIRLVAIPTLGRYLSVDGALRDMLEFEPTSESIEARRRHGR